VYEEGTLVGGRYAIGRRLGGGGQADVYAAVSSTTGRSVAIKVLQPQADGAPRPLEDCRREAIAIGAIRSDHVVEVLDVVEDDPGGPFLVLELLEGETLLDRLKRGGPVPLAELHPLVTHLWLGLRDIHQAGVLHRSLKPSNMFLEHRPDGTIRAKIIGFTLASAPGLESLATLAECGRSLGTFSFMAPEQIGKASTIDHRADIYACATLIYQALSGELPYEARNILAMVEMKTSTDARRLSDALGDEVETDLDAFLARGLARSPEDRFPSAEEALAAWQPLRRKLP